MLLEYHEVAWVDMKVDKPVRRWSPSQCNILKVNWNTAYLDHHKWGVGVVWRDWKGIV